MHVKGAKGKKIADVFIKTSAIFYRNLYKSYNDLYRFSVALAVLFIVRTAKASILSLFCRFYLYRNASI